MKNLFRLFFVLFIGCICFSHLAFAQSPSANNTTDGDIVTTMKARVLSVTQEPSENLPSGDNGLTQVPVQSVRAVVLDGAEAGNEIVLANDYMPMKKGEVFYATHDVNSSQGYDVYQVTDIYRLPVLFVFIGIFIICVALFGGIQGVRGLVSLLGSLVLIFKILLPGILHGISPLLLALLVSLAIVTLGSYITHGFNKTTSSAVIGMIITVLLVGGLAWIGVHSAHLSGFTNEETVYLNSDTNGAINFPQLILGGIMIGLLGVLYDVAIGQAVSVEELHRLAPHISRKIIYTRALRIGREHVGALVNMLAIAYVGVSLPILLYYLQAGTSSFAMTMNSEVFATEILRTMIGSIGLVIAVPITTLISTIMLVHPKKSTDEKTLHEEKYAIEHAGHHH